LDQCNLKGDATGGRATMNVVLLRRWISVRSWGLCIFTTFVLFQLPVALV